MRGRARGWFLPLGVCAVAAAAILVFAEPSRSVGIADRLIHDEDFSSAAAYDASFWTTETGLFRNREAQYYRPENISVRNGALVLEGRRETVLNPAYDLHGADWLTTTRKAHYTSGSLVSREAFTYGVFEIVARVPQAAGAWPAIWTVGGFDGGYREIDIAEAVGNTPGKVFSNVYGGKDFTSLKNWTAATLMPGLADGFHTYRLEWRKDLIAIAIDGREVLRMDPEQARGGDIDPLRASMHLRINLALGGSWGGAIDDKALPAQVEVKSVRIWSVAP